MSKDITPEFKSEYNNLKSSYSTTTKDKYIDKGNLTSRECGRLVKEMVSDYEERYWY